jgi:hypothetical protein
MYRHPAQINVARASLPSPARDESSDSESEILAELNEKRKELDDEIANFKAQKEKEFQKFEQELRSQKKTRRLKTKDTKAAKGTSAASAVSSLFVGSQVRPNGLSKGKKFSGDLSNSRSRQSAVLSPPTLGVEKLTINGTTTPPRVGTPPLTRSLSRSPTNLSITPPRRSTNKSSNRRDEEKTDFSGLFTPTYLPLLEARQGNSLPPDRVASSQARRALTAPTIPSTSLPSALRTASGSTIRKTKHVTFQLEDAIIVEPSSSYEELPSPLKQVQTERMDEMIYVAPKNTIPAPVSLDFGDRFVAASNGGSRVGFFELDEELDDLDDQEIEYHEVSKSMERRMSLSILIKLQELEEEDQKNEHDEDNVEEELKSGSFHSGSLPIDIVRPGSFRDSSTSR